jgi:hypothetical protein
MAQATRTPIERHPVEKGQDLLASTLGTVATIILVSGLGERFGLDADILDAIILLTIAVAGAVRHVIERKRDLDVQFVLDELAKAGEPGQKILDRLNERKRSRVTPPAAALLIFVPLLFTGCLTKTLRVPAEDHAVQTTVILQRCELAEIDPCPVPLDDLRAMARQAELIDDIVKGDKPEPASVEGGE